MGARIALAVASVAGAGCAGTGAGDGPPLLPERLGALEPTAPGTYRMVGTEADSRTGAVSRAVETYEVEPAFPRDGDQRQITRQVDLSGALRWWETVLRSDGAFRLRESAGEASWDWAPSFRTLALPLQVGRTWRVDSTATVPDLAGVRRVSRVRSRSEVVEATTVKVDGSRVFVFVVEATVSTTVTDTDRVTRIPSTVVLETEGRTWFSLRHMLVVKSFATTRVSHEGGDGGDDYQLTRRLELDDL